MFYFLLAYWINLVKFDEKSYFKKNLFDLSHIRFHVYCHTLFDMGFIAKFYCKCFQPNDFSWPLLNLTGKRGLDIVIINIIYLYRSKMPRFTSRRHERRAEFFLTKPGPFFMFLVISYAGILWVLFQMLFADINDHSHTFVIARFWFQRVLGVINFSAFLSFWVQVLGICEAFYDYYFFNLSFNDKQKKKKKAHGLIGENGISPISKQLKDAETQVARLTIGKYAYIPSIFWLDSSDRMLHLVCFLGCFFSASIIFACYLPTSVFFLLCAFLYLSLKSVGDSFMQLQWDAMIIELNTDNKKEEKTLLRLFWFAEQTYNRHK
ncbi:DUF1222 family protein [Reticulomyxa filosa]|uniref:DUF1222 family protein n=1 Tax=Reticulomyxa filosa TaxID=46433 RepID=X6NML2_RETFI|nr:DUF1222 family protein [Reticulomyxa filosa]|eukprot:ETO27495.1 DUF1222 family protein [Reticulomyxa filosa]